MLVTSLFVKESNISDLWELDLIGINDPIEKLSKKKSRSTLSEKAFFETLKYTKEGRSFELRDWTFTSSETNSSKSSDLLGLWWDTHPNVIAFSLDWIEDIKLEIITKRTMLSIAHRLFDPFGVASPVMLCPKLMLQETWKIWIKVTPETFDNCCLHVFCDASKDACTAVAYLVLHGECNDVFLLFSRSRITPLKGAAIPRLEILAAVLGARFSNSITNAFEWRSIKRYFWSDSTTVTYMDYQR
ncbi:endonuclease [Caerostris extrusa]|uniref:Endonuclease n=1 Tax=Caerostris extrusa TaxID=172846 RepID=A0AAV4N799_CAEEX|nr:endonuclease [Caerostris extrusa]